MGRLAKLEPKWDKSRRRWCISIPERLSSTGRRQRKFFAHEDEARNYCKRIKSIEQRNIQLVRKISPELVECAVYFDELFQLYGFSGLKDACSNLESRLKQEHKSHRFDDLLRGYEKEHFGEWSDDHQRSWLIFKRLFQEMQDQLIPSLSTQHWREILQKQASERNWSARSFNYYLGRISTVYNWGLKNGFCDNNPTLGISRKKQKKSAVSILMPSQIQLILETAWEHDKDMVPYFAIGIFAGLRPNSELESLTWEDVNFEEKWIRVGFGNKTDTKRFVPLEDNLQDWLTPWKTASGKVCPSTVVNRRQWIVRGKYQAKPGSKEKEWQEIASWKQRDIMRHSYGSYLEARYKDRNIVKENMGHTDYKTYEQHYRNARTPKQAFEFWNIFSPSSERESSNQNRDLSKAS